jgi:hypothetical protein
MEVVMAAKDSLSVFVEPGDAPILTTAHTPSPYIQLHE